jgi:hypothetical protein
MPGLTAEESSVWVRRDGQRRWAMQTESLSGDPYGRDKEQGSSAAGGFRFSSQLVELRRARSKTAEGP